MGIIKMLYRGVLMSHTQGQYYGDFPNLQRRRQRTLKQGNNQSKREEEATKRGE